MTATTIPCSVPSRMTPANAMTDQRNSVVRTRRIARNCFGWMSSSEYQMTTAASAACGIHRVLRGEQQQGRESATAVTSSAACDLAPASRLIAVCEVPPPAGMAPSNPPAALATPSANNSRLGSDKGSSRSAKARAAAIDSVKLISAMPIAGGHRAWTSARFGHVYEGSPVGTCAHGGYPVRGQVEQRGGRDRRCHGDERRGYARHEAFQPEDQHDDRRRDGERDEGRLRQVCENRESVVEETGLLDVHAEQFRQLVDDDHEPDARFESDQHGFRDEIRDETQSQQPGREQHQPDHHRERCRGDQQVDPGAVRHGAQCRSGQDRDRRRRADAERSRSAKQRVNDHGHERRIQSDLHGEPGDRRERHGFRDDDRRSR